MKTTDLLKETLRLIGVASAKLDAQDGNTQTANDVLAGEALRALTQAVSCLALVLAESDAKASRAAYEAGVLANGGKPD